MVLLPPESAGIALGSLSLFGQTLTACVHGFERYSLVRNLGTEFTDLQRKLSWTRSRLATWASDWGISDGRHLEDDRFQRYVEMATSHLVYINYLLAELAKAEEALPTLETAGWQARSPVAALSRWSKTGDVSAAELKDLTDKIERLNAEASTVEKVRYYLADSRAPRMVDTVRSMVEDLFLQFPPPRDDIAASLARNRALQSNSHATLDAAARDAKVDPALAALTLLKVESLRLEQRSDQLASADPEEPTYVIVEGSEAWKGSRGTAFYFNEEKFPRRVPVLVEKKEVPSEGGYQRHHERIRNVARLLSMKGKPREMRTLDCLGVVSVGDETLTTHKLLYRLPAARFFTLSSILNGQRAAPLPLGKKFACAKVLCRAVLWVHLAGWLHKNICSSNVVFAADEVSQVNIAEPYICGFEYSRHIIAPQDTEPLAGDASNNMYRHPDVQGLPQASRGTERPEFGKAHDVYALGMVLLELGSRRSLSGLKERYEDSGRRWSAEPFREWLVNKEVMTLVPRMGEIYTDVVRICLKGIKRDDGESFQETFFKKVVKKIDLCTA
ncbi:HET-s/LopB domain protein [Cordyceps fumosorosea ARSEF 2679]|uniref:HET-s/LopB domain protein n=1 Tax=Cordyceps fumosorosea (strain ARSEF 2679) TaxID=1081104 RepID=A0A167NNR9_CORFA|nr:HET-s/LopB domain protein [Cordyceps fumosorosea ARSEF 2679]OAA55764.1 HET-s/LopB domain protein [Cordyceps fumosorosea ARSEF 2679]